VNDTPLSRCLIIGIIWAYGFCGGIAYANWCRPLAWDCIAVLPVWGLSGLALFGIAVIPLEALFVIVLRNNLHSRTVFNLRNAAAIFVAQIIAGIAVGDLLILRFGVGAP